MVTPEQVNAANRALSWIHLFKPWALAFVALGVAYEFVADRLEKPYNKILETAHDEEMARLTASTIEAQRGAAEANERTETLRKENLALQSDILKLRARTEFRHLTSEQQRTISDKMNEFRGLEFALVVYNVGDDASAIANDITAALESAGWKPGQQSGTSASAPETGILVEVNPSARVLASRAANELAEALRHEGLFVPPMRTANQAKYSAQSIPAQARHGRSE